MAEMVTFKIHPAIGIARVGNSPDHFFIGPEKVGDDSVPAGGYKDSQMRIKRQAARFRIYGYDADGNMVKEINMSDADIKWTVHLANKKAEWKKFHGMEESHHLRNPTIKDRHKLINDPGKRSLDKPNKKEYFNTGKCFDVIVPLGEINTDHEGNLLVLGGFGKSASPHNKPLPEFANNDDWYDDISDGPVTAFVKLKGTENLIEAIPAWVLCTPPDFAPPIENVMSLYDALLQVAIDKLNYTLPAIPSFTKDIYPILKRAFNIQAVNMMTGGKHNIFDKVIPPPGDSDIRKKIFNKLTNPYQPNDGEDNDMPMVWSDYYPHKGTKKPFSKYGNQPLLKFQYDILKKWSDGIFDNDWNGIPPASTEITPHGLDRSALEKCVGGPLHPGIEASWFIRDKFHFSEPFRLSHKHMAAGDVTKQMALPWQADFYDCQQEGDLAWWPSQRPDNVFINDHDAMQHKWTRGHVTDHLSMVKHWNKLGFIINKNGKYIESERNP